MTQSTPTKAPAKQGAAAQRDHAAYKERRDSSTQELLTYAARQTARTPFHIMADHRRIAAGDGRLNMVEYIRTGLYRTERFTTEERAAFISNDLHWPITHQCNNQAWTAAAEDKILAATLLNASAIAVPETLAIVGKTQRIYPGLDTLSDAGALKTFLTGYFAKEDAAPIFAKILDGMVSFGAFRIEAADSEGIHTAGHPPMSYESFLQDQLGDDLYLLQTTLKNDSAFAPYASALATVRMVNLVTDAGVQSPMAVLKLPQGDNIADAFWRPGNLACGVDVATGKVTTVAQRGIETDYLEDHPEVAGLMGLTLPHWEALKALNARAARVFAPIRYQSTDIALTPEGPVIIELNYGGGFDLPQYANGRGLLTPEVRAFFASCGVELGAKRKKGWFRR